VPAGAARQAAALLSIGQVLSRLHAEFPDLSSSKLRFLEEQGLISPARTESGYRKFCAADIDRVRLILTMQRDHYLPLKVIRKNLEDLDAGRPVDLGGATPPASIFPAGRALTRAELLRRSGAAAALLDAAVSAGLVTGGDTFRDEAVGILAALASLERVGIGPRHLRALRAAAEREADLVESAVSPLRRRGGASGRSRADDLAREIVSSLEAIRAQILQAELARRLG